VGVVVGVQPEGFSARVTEQENGEADEILEFSYPDGVAG
jgi:hypothetical protein